jgi:hypothetical protein
MALELKIRVTGIDGTNYSYFVVEDENDTLDTSKQYGQGGNPARNTLGLFLYVTKKEVGDDVDTIVYNTNQSPESAASWQVDYNEDNWFEHILIAAVDWDIAEVGYVANDVVYDSQKLWMAVAPVTGSQPGDVSGEWTDVTNAPTTILAGITGGIGPSTGTFDYNVTLNDVRLEISGVAFAKLTGESSKNGQCLNCNHDNKDRQNLIKFHLNAAQVACDQALFTQAQYNVVTLKALTAS